MIIQLDGNVNYSVEELKVLLMSKYVDDKNRWYFENSSLEIGTIEELQIRTAAKRFTSTEPSNFVFDITSDKVPCKKIATANQSNHVVNENSKIKEKTITESPIVDNTDSELQNDRTGSSSEHHSDKISTTPTVPLKKKPKISGFSFTIPQIDESELTFLNEIGRGAQGIVRKGKYLFNDVAIKTMQRGTRDKFIIKELKLLEKVCYPGVINVQAFSYTPMQFHIVTDFFESFSLFDAIFNDQVKKEYDLSTENKKYIAAQICSALAYLHYQPSPIIHRDIKPGNILVAKNYKTKLCDLGLGKCGDLDNNLNSTCVGTLRGTLVFMSPEAILDRKEATTYSDIWALGCTLVELFSEKEMWHEKQILDILSML
ncbi:probable serine/threonine-protein kinase DDB_G0281745 [Copidosoma floridanum]|uniref:probable serine/threonine-protein kinase DDB_G0281745 n=1 Tax=Copidosoma floridanum TaxID=29053 RepID=UPI000C6F986A|nr:probable serine/threonine-protein kinase DDB_G0281745 [Copidosoma floridanum]